MEASASAPAAISVVNAIPTGRGSALAIDERIAARVSLDPKSPSVTADIADDRAIDTTLIRRCVERITERYGAGEGGHVETTAKVPHSVGLKTSSAATNAAVWATIEALGCADQVTPLAATRIGVEVAREVGVTVTGAFDDAAASMVGGLVVTDNETDDLLDHHERDDAVVILIPEGRTPTESVDVSSLKAVAPISELAFDEVLEDRPEVAMALNAMAVTAALDLDGRPLRLAMTETMAVSPTGTGPAIAAIGSPETCTTVAADWSSFGDVIETRVDTDGVRSH